MTREKCEKTAAGSTLVYLIMKVITLCVPFLDSEIAWLMKILFFNACLWISYSWYFEFRQAERKHGVS